MSFLIYIKDLLPSSFPLAFDTYISPVVRFCYALKLVDKSTVQGVNHLKFNHMVFVFFAFSFPVPSSIVLSERPFLNLLDLRASVFLNAVYLQIRSLLLTM